MHAFASSSLLLLFAEFCKEYYFDDINCFVFRTERLTIIGNFKPAIHAWRLSKFVGQDIVTVLESDEHSDQYRSPQFYGCDMA